MWLALVVLTALLTSCNKDEDVNSNPIIQSIQVNPNSVAANGVVTISVTAVDPDGDALTYAYVVTGGAISGVGPSVSWTAPSTSGANQVTVTVSDGKGGYCHGQRYFKCATIRDTDYRFCSILGRNSRGFIQCQGKFIY